MSWVRNNWRVKKKQPQLTHENKYRLTDILWWTRPQDVCAEIALIMNLPTVTTNTPGWFQQRLAATKNLLNKMTEEERRKLEDEAEKYRMDGLPLDVQRK